MGSGMLGLEMPIHQPQQQNPHHLHHHQQQHQHPPQMIAFAHHESDHHQQSQQSAKQGYPYALKPKQLQLAISDDDEPGFTADESTGDGKRKISPWQRMKWTDGMVTLLIMAVYYIGDEGGSEGTDPIGKKKGSGSLQKKGKWKSVSRAMMEKGFSVSPQQCEDKFNDLNKRYKRVNDILGKGTACRVVENQSLLDTMDHLSPKMKEEVRKLLNSKHLFFREMCAYHNSCPGGNTGGGGGGGAGGTHHSPDNGTEPSHPHHQSQQQKCLHSVENASMVPNSGRAETEGSKMVKGGSGEDEFDYDEYEDDDEDEDDDDDDEEVVEGRMKGENEHGHDEDDENDERCSRKRQRKEMFPPPSAQLSRELTSMLQDGTKSQWEKRQWMRAQLVQLEERRVNCQFQAFELEKQRLKWVQFSSKKEREMERGKLKNERMSLENERMTLLLRQKELEFFELNHHQQSTNKRGDPSPISG